jgi:hypothetical protein
MESECYTTRIECYKRLKALGCPWALSTIMSALKNNGWFRYQNTTVFFVNLGPNE